MKKIHAEIRIYGIVQGVGFRPFVHKKASEFSLCGAVKNTSYGAFLELEGEQSAVDSFITNLRDDAPKLAFIEKILCERSNALCGYESFEIEESERGVSRRTLISPDVATCEDCLRELFSKGDRRYKYPFINCTNCGPRFTIVRDIPYDRKNTTMEPFPMCDKCRSEYGDIEDRRYHAQPDCCEECGPSLCFYDEDGVPIDGDAIEAAKKHLADGKIIAVKGLGGVHLACRCDDEAAVRRLRERKLRDEKPFAIMCRDIDAARRYAVVSQSEENLLTSHRRPIVLLSKKNRKELMHISENGYVGIMLPYTPVHHLLLSDGQESLVMTSANLSDLPIIYKDEECLSLLRGVADGFLLNNREIHVRCDDSLLWEIDGREYFVRRSRGYAPHPVISEKSLPAILACGAEQKASFALSREYHVFPSQHIGDLKNLETLDSYEEQIAHFENIFDVKPCAIACDMHPDYMSSEYAAARAERDGVPLFRIQHHHAHMASCMADNGYDGECIGIIWDGTGLGTDGKAWGAEFLVGGFSSFERRGTIVPIRLPGGDRAAKDIKRIAASLLDSAGLPCDEAVKTILDASINCPEVTGMGRLFDGISALLGICEVASYEGRGAVLLEAVAEEGVDDVYPYGIERKNGIYVFDWRDMIRAIEQEIKDGVSKEKSAATFMNTLISFAAETAERISRDTGIKTVALSGGTFQNMYVLKRLVKVLEARGLRVLTHRRVSCNDEGISLGQLYVAAQMHN